MFKNKLYRKYGVATIAAAAATASVAPVVSAADTNFSDVKRGEESKGGVGEHYEAIMELTEKDIVAGYPTTGKFHPWDNVQRGQVAKMMKEILELDWPENVAKALEIYDDVVGSNDYAGYIAAGAAAGIFHGSESKKSSFGEYTDITREQMASVLVRAFHLDDIEVDETVEVNLDGVSEAHQDAVQTLANLGVTMELSDFRAYEGISRAAFASFLVRAEKVQDEKIMKEFDVNSKGTANAAAYSEAGDGGRDFEATLRIHNSNKTLKDETVYVAVQDDDLEGNVQLLDEDGEILKAEDGSDSFNGKENNIFALKTDKEAKVNFTLIGEDGAHATPTVFFDDGEKSGELDPEDAQAKGEKTNFGEAVPESATMTIQDEDGEKIKDVQVGEEASFVYQLFDQNGKPNTSLEQATTFEVRNAGLNEVQVGDKTIPGHESETIKIDPEDGKAIIKVAAEGQAPVSVQAISSKDSIPDKNALLEIKAGSELKEGMYYAGRLMNKSFDSQKIPLKVNGHEHELSYDDEMDFYINRKQVSLDDFEEEARGTNGRYDVMFLKGESDTADELNMTKNVNLNEILFTKNNININFLKADSYFVEGTIGRQHELSLRGTVALEDIADVNEVNVTLTSRQTDDKDDKKLTLYVNEYGVFKGGFKEDDFDEMTGEIDRFYPYDQVTISYTNAGREEVSVTETYEFDY